MAPPAGTADRGRAGRTRAAAGIATTPHPGATSRPVSIAATGRVPDTVTGESGTRARKSVPPAKADRRLSRAGPCCHKPLMPVQLVTALEHRASLRRDPAAPSAARRALARWFEPLLEMSELQRVKLLTSELVTNAVVHGRGEITLHTRLSDDGVLVDVIDEGGGFDYTLSRPSVEDVGGRGLMIVDAEARRWGIRERTSHVWFELARSSIKPDLRVSGFASVQGR
jgi:anti-sigma regulatory factor (Ser/Thr protein kinase)